MVEVNKGHVTHFFYTVLIVIIAGCIVTWGLTSMISFEPKWALGGISSLGFFMVGYITRWMTKKKTT